MKYILIFAILPVMVVAVLVLGNLLPSTQNITYGGPITLYCPDNTMFTVQYSEDRAFARLSLSGVQYELVQTESSSGTRYESQDAAVAVVELQDEVRLILPNSADELVCSLTEVEPQSAWQTYEAPTSNPPVITLRHPERASVSQVQADIFEIKYIGPDSEPNTEITDGYYASIQLVSGTSAEAYAASNNQTGTVSPVRFLERDAFVFKRTSVLDGDPISHYVFVHPHSSDRLVDISFQVFADTKDQYLKEIIAILETLTFGDPGQSATDLITITAPAAGTRVDNPVSLSGEARGYWFFEASAPVDVVNWDGLIIGQGYITAEGEWMTEDFVPFSGTVSYELPSDSYSASGTVIFRRDNPSGLPENDAAVEIPVVLELP